MTPAHLIPSPLGDIAVRIEDDALTGSTSSARNTSRRLRS